MGKATSTIRTALLLFPSLILAAAAAQGRPPQRLERERLLREDAARAFETRYDAAFADAQTAAERSDWESARRSLAECLRYKPHDPAAGRQLNEVTAQIGAIAAWNNRMAGLVAALDARNWQSADQAIHELPESPRSIHPAAHAELVPALRLYARGEWKEARRAASAVVVQGRETAAAGLVLLVNRHLREQWLPPGLAASAGLYLALLTGSLYLGLRGAWSETTA
jgi:hypothetical protein